MANARLLIVDDETGEHLVVARSRGGAWEWCADSDDLNEWLYGRDIEASSGVASLERGAVTHLSLATEHTVVRRAKHG